MLFCIFYTDDADICLLFCRLFHGSDCCSESTACFPGWSCKVNFRFVLNTSKTTFNTRGLESQTLTVCLSISVSDLTIERVSDYKYHCIWLDDFNLFKMLSYGPGFPPQTWCPVLQLLKPLHWASPERDYWTKRKIPSSNLRITKRVKGPGRTEHKEEEASSSR